MGQTILRLIALKSAINLMQFAANMESGSEFTTSNQRKGNFKVPNCL